MDIRKIKKLIELVEESGISELEISEGEEMDIASDIVRLDNVTDNSYP